MILRGSKDLHKGSKDLLREWGGGGGEVRTYSRGSKVLPQWRYRPTPREVRSYLRGGKNLLQGK